MNGIAKRLINGLFDERPVFGTDTSQIPDNGATERDKPYVNRALEAYNGLCAQVKAKGYSIIERPLRYMEERYGRSTIGYEDGRKIEIASDAPVGERLRALLHEYAAKLLKSQTGETHDELHPRICAFAKEMEYSLAPTLG